MFLLVLKRIKTTSETALDKLKSRLENLKISDLEGENIDDVISLIKAVRNTFRNSSTAERNYMPQDFSKMVLQVLQTSSVDEFNSVFKDEYDKAVRAADRTGGSVKWPSLDLLMNLAKNTYYRIDEDSKWVASDHQKKFASPGVSGSAPNTPAYLRPNYKCWNCGTNCGKPLRDCPTPKDEARIKRNKEAFLKERERSRKPSAKTADDKPKHITGSRGKHKGKPLILNKKGVYVLDTAKMAKAKDDDAKSAVAKFFRDASAAFTSGTGSTNSTPTESSTPTNNGSHSPPAAAAATLPASLDDVMAAVNAANWGS